MKSIYSPIIIAFIASIAINCSSPKENASQQSPAVTGNLPLVLPVNHADLIDGRLRLEAALKFSEHHLPDNLKDWEEYKLELKETILEKTGFDIDHSLPLDIKETGIVEMKGFSVKNLAYQAHKGIYATASLFIPEGNGPFPAVLVSSGHSINGRLGSQTLGQLLALNGFVCLAVDPWGAGERTTSHGTFEYHGANLGASLMNVGESLMGMQITDNMRGVDLLCSLPYVDPEKIGATGASGGGNQTMWLSAIDERIKVSVPVVSVGTFESYVMWSNCICEVLIDGLTFTEESGVLALIAPRALKISNGLKDANRAFNPSEMLRSFDNAKPVYELYGAGNNISHLIFDGPHSYPPETREAMLGLFELVLKGRGDGSPKKRIPSIEPIPQEKLMTFVAGERDPGVLSTEEFCKRKGEELRSAYLNTGSFDAELKRDKLKNILRLNEEIKLKKVHRFNDQKGWERYVLETSDHRMIPLLHVAPADRSMGYTIVCNPAGKKDISAEILKELQKKGSGIAIADLSGTGEVTSSVSEAWDRSASLITMARAELWLGRTVLGEWVKELEIVSGFLKDNLNASVISIDGSKEAGLAGLFLSAVGKDAKAVILRDAPVSYLFDSSKNINYFGAGIHLPGILAWGDISLAAALGGNDVTFINPVTMSGQKPDENEMKEYQAEFDNIRKIIRQKGETFFN